MFNTCNDGKLVELQYISWPGSLRLLWFLVAFCCSCCCFCVAATSLAEKVVNVFQKSIKISWYAIVNVIDFFQLVNVTDIEQQYSCVPFGVLNNVSLLLLFFYLLQSPFVSVLCTLPNIVKIKHYHVDGYNWY